MSRFHRNLRIIREASGLSCTAMANKLGIKPSTFSYYLKDREPPYDTLMKIARTFDVSVDWLLGFDDMGKLQLESENANLKFKLKRIKELLENENLD